MPLSRAEKRRRLRSVKKQFAALGEFEFLALGQTGRQTAADVRETVPGASAAEVDHAMTHFNRCWHFASRDYHVAVDKETEHGFGPLGDLQFWHLSIKRHDREPMNDWRVMQRIKTEIAGAGAEGMELYPAESRVVDTANQYHLWCLIGEDVRLPFGFQAGARTDNESGGSKQRPGAGGDSADHWDERPDDEDDGDPTPWCHVCNSMTQAGCDCLPIAENN